MARIAVFGPHPDDQDLGMGGTIAAHSRSGDQVSLLFLGTGVGARMSSDNAEVKRRANAAEGAAHVLGAEIVQVHDFPDNAFDQVPLLELVQAIESAKRHVQPDLVYTHHGGDLNIDHRLCCQATLTAFRPQPNERCREIRTFEVNSSTEWSAPSVTPAFQPNLYIDIGQTLGQLESALRCYGEEMRDAPHSRAVESVLNAARFRGSQVGLDAAESFMVLRRIVSIDRERT